MLITSLDNAIVVAIIFKNNIWKLGSKMAHFEYPEDLNIPRNDSLVYKLLTYLVIKV